MFGASVPAKQWQIDRSVYIDFQGTPYKYHANLWDPAPEASDVMLTFFTCQPDGQARIDQFDLDRTRWRAGLIDSAWPLTRQGNVYTQAPFDHLYVGSANGTINIAGVEIFWNR